VLRKIFEAKKGEMCS